MKETIALAMIVKDGEETLERCLSSVKLHVDKIYIGIDSRTTDSTKEIAEKYGAIISYFDWKDDFSYARNVVANQADTDWVFVLDADDYITQVSGSLIPDPQYNGATVIVKTSEVTQVESNRIYRPKEGEYKGKIHEVVVYDTPKLCTIPVQITHTRGKIQEPGRNLRILESEIKSIPRTLFYFGKENVDLGNFEIGIKALKHYLQLSIYDAEKLSAMATIAKGYYQLQNKIESRKYCFMALSQEINFQPSYVILAQIAYDEKDWKSVINWSLSALNLNQIFYIFDNRIRDTELCWDLLSIAYYQLNQLDKGLIWMKKCLAFSPDNERYQNNMKFYQEYLDNLEKIN